MTRNNTLWKPVETAELDWTVADEPRSTRYNDIYYSTGRGREESDYVFLQGNGLPARWEAHDRPVFCIVELGFGTGLNFLHTWNSWQGQSFPCPELHYVAIEKHPLKKRDLMRALAAWPSLLDQATQLLDHYPQPIPGQHRIVMNGGTLTLDLWWEDISTALEDLAGNDQRAVDAWYLDGFAPARNECMWHESVYTAMGIASRPGATFSTFTAASEVRRGLQKVGFEVLRAPGFGQKRESLRGSIKNQLPAPHPTSTPWDLDQESRPPPASALVVGAGLAGCTVAAALARRGIHVTLLEQGKVASAGSGNNQGILYTRLSTRHSNLSDFALQSFCFAGRLYQDLFDSGRLIKGEDGALCGSFAQSDRVEEMSALSRALQSVPDIARVVDAAQAGALLGVAQSGGGYWLPGSGWLRPASVCLALIDHPQVQLIENAGQITLLPNRNGWQAQLAGEPVAQADCAIIATGVTSNRFEALTWLPLQAIRGQTTELPSNPSFSELKAGLCHTGYISPARHQSHCIGATFDLNDEDLEVRLDDHRRNLDALAAAVPDWHEMLAALDPGALQGRVGYRCATPDYLPMVGAVPDYQAFLRDYSGLRKNAKASIGDKGSYLPGLFLTTGHGSRGLSSTPLAAEQLASRICGEVRPMSRELSRAIAPARFIIRGLQRGRL